MVRRLRSAIAIAVLLPAVASAQAPTTPHARGSWMRFWSGFATSILAHEGGHITASLLQGARPTFGLDHGRPTVYSGIDPELHPHKQFMFSSAGLDVQALVNEAILDDPGHGGGPFQRGVLAAGLATTAFYLTIGRTASVSDVAYMRRTSGLTSSQITLIYGGVALIQLVRIERDGRFVDFFVHPDARAGFRVGVDLR
ncbi:MAG: hypothetical protein ACRENQ_06335 [Gemmatimonadaceae bacterium]